MGQPTNPELTRFRIFLTDPSSGSREMVLCENKHSEFFQPQRTQPNSELENWIHVAVCAQCRSRVTIEANIGLSLEPVED